jgi:hypothetical protein
MRKIFSCRSTSSRPLRITCSYQWKLRLPLPPVQSSRRYSLQILTQFARWLVIPCLRLDHIGVQPQDQGMRETQMMAHSPVTPEAGTWNIWRFETHLPKGRCETRIYRLLVKIVDVLGLKFGGLHTSEWPMHRNSHVSSWSFQVYAVLAFAIYRDDRSVFMNQSFKFDKIILRNDMTHT